jgi:hypothetical protein
MQIHFPNDLQICALVCREWRCLLAQRVYQSLKPTHTTIGPPPLHIQKRLPCNATLKYVRNLDLSRIRDATSGPRRLLSLLHILHREQVLLTSFVAPTVLSYPQFLQLFQLKRGLKTLELKMLRSITQDVQNQAFVAMLTLLDYKRPILALSLPELTELNLCITNEPGDHNTNIFLAAMLTQEAPRLTKLSLSFIRTSLHPMFDIISDISRVHQRGRDREGIGNLYSSGL